MKRFLALMLAVLMLTALCACSNGKTVAQEDTSAQMANPMTEYDELSKVNELCGMKLTGPAVMGKSDEAYFVTDCGDYQIGEYRFSLNGANFVLRGAKTQDDISGIYINGASAFQGMEGDATISTPEYRLARWFTDDGQYVLITEENSELSAEQFASMEMELEQLTK